MMWPTAIQDIYSDKEIIRISKINSSGEIIGPDTALFWWQVARKEANGDFSKADEIRDKAKKLGYNLSFDGKRYRAFYTEEEKKNNYYLICEFENGVIWIRPNFFINNLNQRIIK